MLSSCVMSFHCINKLQFMSPYAADKPLHCFWQLLTIVIGSAQAILHIPLLYICVGYIWDCAPQHPELPASTASSVLYEQMVLWDTSRKPLPENEGPRSRSLSRGSFLADSCVLRLPLTIMFTQIMPLPASGRPCADSPVVVVGRMTLAVMARAHNKSP